MNNTRMKPRFFAVGFFKNQTHILSAIDDWCDVYWCPSPPDQVGGIAGGPYELASLNIDYSQYDVCLTFTDSAESGFLYLSMKCMAHGIQMISNQHGYHKSIREIVGLRPNCYTRYWNAFGQYWLDRYRAVYGGEPAEARLIALGSLKHDGLHRKYRWNPNRTNGKVLVLHEPDTDICEYDPFPYKACWITERLVNALEKNNIAYDFKVHPSWDTFIGNNGESMWKPEHANIVNIGMKEMLDYEVVLGCWSSCLFDAAAMGMPAINLNFPNFPTENDGHWGPDEVKLFRRCEPEEAPAMLESVNGDYDSEALQYFLGPLGKVKENFFQFMTRNFSW